MENGCRVLSSFSYKSISEIRYWCQVRIPGGQSAFQFIPEVFSGLGMSAWVTRVLLHQSWQTTPLWTSICSWDTNHRLLIILCIQLCGNSLEKAHIWVWCLGVHILLGIILQLPWRKKVMWVGFFWVLWFPPTIQIHMSHEDCSLSL